MVALRFTKKRGIEQALDATTTSLTGSESVTPLRIVEDQEAEAFTSLALESFAEDWESDEDSVYDSLLEDADLQ